MEGENPVIAAKHSITGMAIAIAAFLGNRKRIMASKMDNYPTVCLEANCCGTPVVGFDVGGVAETIFPGMGEVVPYGNTEQLLERCLHWAEKKKDIPSQTISAVLKENSKERMTAEYISLYCKILEGKYE
jgi:glycosyltransferase involved in cell wall biosynthesis